MKRFLYSVAGVCTMLFFVGLLAYIKIKILPWALKLNVSDNIRFLVALILVGGVPLVFWGMEKGFQIMVIPDKMSKDKSIKNEG